jgi:hypothetical protein
VIGDSGNTQTPGEATSRRGSCSANLEGVGAQADYYYRNLCAGVRQIAEAGSCLSKIRQGAPPAASSNKRNPAQAEEVVRQPLTSGWAEAAGYISTGESTVCHRASQRKTLLSSGWKDHPAGARASADYDDGCVCEEIRQPIRIAPGWRHAHTSK